MQKSQGLNVDLCAWQENGCGSWLFPEFLGGSFITTGALRGFCHPQCSAVVFMQRRWPKPPQRVRLAAINLYMFFQTQTSRGFRGTSAACFGKRGNVPLNPVAVWSEIVSEEVKGQVGCEYHRVICLTGLTLPSSRLTRPIWLMWAKQVPRCRFQREAENNFKLGVWLLLFARGYHSQKPVVVSPQRQSSARQTRCPDPQLPREEKTHEKKQN